MGDVDVNRSPTECPLCYDNYTHEGSSQPRMIIPCGHTVCYACITKLASQPAMVCPICRKKCPHRFISEAGFPINYLAITLLENQKKSGLSIDDTNSRGSSNSDVNRSPKISRSKSAVGSGGKTKGENECSECKRATSRLSYCFHCASPVCEDCRIQHTEGVVNDLEKESNTVQDQKRLLVKKIEALQRMISILEDNCSETENDIDDNFTIIQHEVAEAKTRLMESLNQKYSKERQRLQTHCETLTEALEKAGSTELPDVMEKNVKDITGNEIAVLCEAAMEMLVNSRNLRMASKSVKMKYQSFSFAHGDKLASIRNTLQKFGCIKVQSRLPKKEQWDPDEEGLSDSGMNGRSILSSVSLNASVDGVLTDDNQEDDSDTSKRKNSSLLTKGSYRKFARLQDSDATASDDEEEVTSSRPLDRYSQRSASVYIPTYSNSSIRASPYHTATVVDTNTTSRNVGGGGVKSKVRNKLVKQQSSSNASSSNSPNMLKSASLSRLDTVDGDDGYSDVSRKNSVGGIESQSAPPVQHYDSLKEKYENIRGPVSSLIYRENSKGHVLDVVARYRSSGFVIADNNEYKIRAFNSNYHLSAQFSFKIDADDVPFISGIATTSDKMFLLVDSKNKYVRVFDRKGTHLRDIGKDLFQRPKDVCTDDIEIFVTDSGASCVQVFDMQGKHLRTLGGPGSADGEFLWPAGMKMTTEGKLVICDCNNNRIQYITKDGDHIQNITSVYGTYSALRPTCVDLDKENNVIVLFAESRRVKIYNKDLQVLHDFRVEDELNSVAVTTEGLIALVDGSKTGKCFIY